MMTPKVILAAVLLSRAAASLPGAVTIEEDFSANPLERGWQVFGDARLFAWDSTNQALEVTWDSSRPNSFFYRRLGTILTKSDDFSLELRFLLRDITIGVNPDKPYTFEVAAGFMNLASATSPNFFRGAGIHPLHGPRNLVEFDYFPDSGFGATVAPTVVSTNNQLRFSDNHPLELTTGDWFEVRMVYTASDETLRTIMTRDGEPFGLPPDQTIRELSLAGFPDFRVDAVAIMSYNDGQQSPPQFAGSLLAHGAIDRLMTRVPEPPIGRVAGRLRDGWWEVRFQSLTNWSYVLEGTADFRKWAVLSDPVAGNGMDLLLENRAAPGSLFYRVRALKD